MHPRFALLNHLVASVVTDTIIMLVEGSMIAVIKVVQGEILHNYNYVYCGRLLMNNAVTIKVY